MLLGSLKKLLIAGDDLHSNKGGTDVVTLWRGNMMKNWKSAGQFSFLIYGRELKKSLWLLESLYNHFSVLQ